MALRIQFSPSQSARSQARQFGAFYAGLTKIDAAAIFEYLRSLPLISYKVPGPFGLDDKPAIFRMTILPPDHAKQNN